MPNPYHDAEGKFASHDEMKNAVQQAADQGDLDAYLKLRTGLEEAERPTPNHRKLTPRQAGTVYRVGSLTPQETHFNDLNQLLQDFAATTPPGRPGRHDGLFASPDLQSHGRWVLGVRYGRGDQTSHELVVNPDECYVYPVELYEAASSAQYKMRAYNTDDRKFREAAEKYWAAGVTLTQWRELNQKHPYEPGTWEILIPKNGILSHKPVSNKRIIENSDKRWWSQLGAYLERSRYVQGKLWARKQQPNETL